jgi:hypothetical protein
VGIDIFVMPGLSRRSTSFWLQFGQGVDAWDPSTPRLRRAFQCWSAEALAKAGKPGHDELVCFNRIVRFSPVGALWMSAMFS